MPSRLVKSTRWTCSASVHTCLSASARLFPFSVGQALERFVPEIRRVSRYSCPSSTPTSTTSGYPTVVGSTAATCASRRRSIRPGTRPTLATSRSDIQPGFTHPPVGTAASGSSPCRRNTDAAIAATWASRAWSSRSSGPRRSIDPHVADPVARLPARCRSGTAHTATHICPTGGAELHVTEPAVWGTARSVVRLASGRDCGRDRVRRSTSRASR